VIAGFVVVALQSATSPALPAAKARPAMEEVAVLETSYGEIVWRFLPAAAPQHTAYVKELIRRGFYDGTTFHRVIPHFVAQGGDPLSKDDLRANDGEGEADRKLKAEFSETLHYRPGTVGMARDADPDSGSCQFFIALESIPRLDKRYTIFGEVIGGLEVARRIADLPRDDNDNPLERVTVKARLESRDVPRTIVSEEPAPSGEVLTGPGKPRFFDPKNPLWKPPVLRTPAAAGAAGARPPARLDVAVAEDGCVIDVRFPDLKTAEAAALAHAARAWIFEPATYDGAPVKARIEIDADGAGIGPPTGGGAPLEAGAALGIPVPAVRVDLPAGRKAPAKPPKLRLTIDAAGAVTDATIQSGCGEADLDAAAVESARRLLFTPLTRTIQGLKDPQPVAVYLDVEARFVEPKP
jgi:peptidyl-prolyl cis-trans isomerase B (cyclophilin B)